MTTAQQHAVAEITGRFAATDARMRQGHATARDLRQEKAQMMVDWAALVAAHDLEEIARRSQRLAEIAKELARFGL